MIALPSLSEEGDAYVARLVLPVGLRTTVYDLHWSRPPYYQTSIPRRADVDRYAVQKRVCLDRVRAFLCGEAVCKISDFEGVKREFDRAR